MTPGPGAQLLMLDFYVSLGPEHMGQIYVKNLLPYMAAGTLGTAPPPPATPPEPPGHDSSDGLHGTVRPVGIVAPTSDASLGPLLPPRLPAPPSRGPRASTTAAPAPRFSEPEEAPAPRAR